MVELGPQYTPWEEQLLDMLGDLANNDIDGKQLASQYENTFLDLINNRDLEFILALNYYTRTFLENNEIYGEPLLHIDDENTFDKAALISGWHEYIMEEIIPELELPEEEYYKIEKRAIERVGKFNVQKILEELIDTPDLSDLDIKHFVRYIGASFQHIEEYSPYEQIFRLEGVRNTIAEWMNIGISEDEVQSIIESIINNLQFDNGYEELNRIVFEMFESLHKSHPQILAQFHQRLIQDAEVSDDHSLITRRAERLREYIDRINNPKD